MFGQIMDIAQGHYNEFTNKEQELSQKRLKICKECPLYTESILGPMCDSKKCYDPDSKVISTLPESGFICGCGCRLKAKTTLEHAKCVLNKW